MSEYVMAISRSEPMMQSMPHCWRFVLAVLHYPGDETDVLLTTRLQSL